MRFTADVECAFDCLQECLSRRPQGVMRSDVDRDSAVPMCPAVGIVPGGVHRPAVVRVSRDFYRVDDAIHSVLHASMMFAHERAKQR
jgi:hypothetical protein